MQIITEIKFVYFIQIYGLITRTNPPLSEMHDASVFPIEISLLLTKSVKRIPLDLHHP